MARSPAALLFVLLGGLLALLAAAAWIVWRPSAAAAEVVAPGTVLAAGPEGPGTREEPAKLVAPRAADLPPVPPEAASAPAATRAEAARAEVVSAGELELRSAVWVEGRVVFPPDTPIGERVRVVATGRKFNSRGPHSAEVGPDGRFRVAFAERTRTGWLQIDAPHLYIPSHKVNAAKPGEIVLEPRVGGRIVGRLLPPADVADLRERLAGSQVVLHAFGQMDGEWQQVMRSSGLDGELRFELRGVPPDLDASITCKVEGMADAHLEDARAVAGQTVEVEISVLRGARISGRLVDEGGGDLTKARVQVTQADDDTFYFGDTLPGDPPAADGSFDLRGVPPGNLRLVARLKGRTDATVELGEVADGAWIQDLAPRLALGSGIEGRVQWPDGRPAEKARVVVLDEGSDPWEWGWSPAETGGVTDAEGRFRLTGLGEGPFRVRAEAVEPGEGRARGARWVAMAEGVRADGPALVLRLEAGYAVQGRVVDDTGAPVPSFGVRLHPEDGAFALRAARSQRFSGDDGRFELQGLHEGSWSVSAFARGHLEVDASVQVPGDGAALTLVLRRSAVLEGVVLDGEGRPVAGASVDARNAGEGGRMREERTRSDGRFSMSDAPSGRLVVRASSRDWSPSPPLELEVAPAQRVEGLVLRLGRGSRLTGELTAALAPVENREIDVWGEGFHRSTRTDSSGRFELTGVPAGELHVQVEDRPSGRGFGTQAASGTVTVEAGRDAHIVLGPDVASAVRLSGTVRNKRGPMAGVQVTVNGHQTHLRAETDEAGRYSLLVPGPGAYHIWLRAENGAMRSRNVTLPDVREWTESFELSGGAIRGRVLDPDGKPLARASVELRGDRGMAGQTMCDGTGAFAFEDLEPGEYVLAGSPPWHRARARLAQTLLPGLHIQGEREIAGVELRLQRAAAIEGHVVMPDGSPAAGVRVIAACDQDSETVETDARGRYSFDSLGAGTWTVSATDGAALVSDASRPLRLESGASASQDLALRRGTMLVVRVQDAKGEPVEAWVLLEGPGRRHDSARHRPDQPARLGPLAPGTYTVKVHDKPATAREVQVHGEAERALTLEIPSE